MPTRPFDKLRKDGQCFQVIYILPGNNCVTNYFVKHIKFLTSDQLQFCQLFEGFSDRQVVGTFLFAFAAVVAIFEMVFFLDFL